MTGNKEQTTKRNARRIWGWNKHFCCWGKVSPKGCRGGAVVTCVAEGTERPRLVSHHIEKRSRALRKVWHNGLAWTHGVQRVMLSCRTSLVHCCHFNWVWEMRERKTLVTEKGRANCLRRIVQKVETLDYHAEMGKKKKDRLDNWIHPFRQGSNDKIFVLWLSCLESQRENKVSHVAGATFSWNLLFFTLNCMCAVHDLY